VSNSTAAAKIDERFAEVRERDAVGHRVHVAFAMAHAFALPLAPAPEAIAFGLLVLYAVIRLPNTWRLYPRVLRAPALLAFAAWMAVHAASILWSIDQAEGLTELKAFRVILLPLALWPVLDCVAWILGSLLGGVLVMNGIQMAQLLNLFGLSTQGDDRARALLHPIQTSAFSLAAVTLYVAAAAPAARAWAAGAKRWLLATLGGGGAALAGLVFAGSRGAWIAAAVVLPIMIIVIVVRRGMSARALAISIVVLAGLVAPVGYFGGGYVVRRVHDGIAEYRAAIHEGDYLSGVGKRVVMLIWAWRFFEESPAFGRGAGSFRELTRDTAEYAAMLAESHVVRRSMERGDGGDGRLTAAHPHSMYLHVLTSTGILGAVPFVAFLVLVVRQVIRSPRDHPFALAMPFVLLGWLIGTQFDCFNLNGHLFGLLGLVMACTLPGRAGERPDVR